MALPVNSKLPSKKSFSAESILSTGFGRPVYFALPSEKNQEEPTTEIGRDSIKPKGKPKYTELNTLNV